jgi:uncharacterized repeat protein (TIGR01451 family)
VATFQVTQAGGCNDYAVSPASLQVPGSGGAFTVNVATDPGCYWDVSGLPGGSWIDFNGYLGEAFQSSGTVTLSVGTNAGPVRTAILKIAGKSLPVTQAPGQTSLLPTLAISKSHSGVFTQGDTGDHYTIIVSNTGQGPTVGNVTVTDQLPDGLTLNAMSGAGWTCAQTSCTNGTILPPGQSYPPVTVTVNVANNAPALVSNTATVSGGGNPPPGSVVTITDSTTIQPRVCTYSVSSGSTSFTSDGGSGAVSVTAPAGCAWTVTIAPNTTWIGSSGGGSGNGTFSYSVGPNTSSVSRTGTITIGGQTLTVTQAGNNCTYSVTASQLSFPSQGGTISVFITTGDRCPWTGTSGAPWITLTSAASGTSTGIISYSVAANTTSGSRTGTVTVAGQTLTVNQSAPASGGGSGGGGNLPLCSFSISPTTLRFDSGGGTGTVSVAAPASCSWTAIVDYAPWITLTSGASGVGNGTVTFQVASYTDVGSRTGNLTIGTNYNQTVNVIQSGINCVFSITPTSQSFTSSGGTGTVSVSAPPLCNWTATADRDWITVTSGTVGTGNGTVSYSVAPNTGSSSVGGSIRINVTNPNLQYSQVLGVNVACACAVIGLTPSVLVFNVAQPGDPDPSPQSFQIRNLGEGILNWTASISGASGGSWLSVNANSGVAPSSVTVTVNPAGLPAGSYTGSIAITANQTKALNSPQTVQVQLAIGTVLAGKGPTRNFTIHDRAGISGTTDGSGGLSLGYVRVQESPGGVPPSGVAIFGYRSNNVLVSETGVPAVPEITSGRIYVEISNSSNTSLNTGIAIANPNSSPVTISFFFTDTSGNRAGSGTIQIPANQQIAQFLNSPPFNVFPGSTFQGTFSFTSDAPVGVIALRGLTNERGDFLMSTLPVIDPTAATSTGTIVLPHFADGGGWTTQILLVNPTDTQLTGSVQFLDNKGAAANLSVGGQTSNSFAYSIPARSAQKFLTGGAGAQTLHGSVRVIPVAGAAPAGLLVFSYKPSAVTVGEAGVPPMSGNAFRMYVETASDTDSGIAVSNLSSSPASITLDITDFTGSPVSGISAVTIALPASGQGADLLSDLFPSLQNPFKGILRITTTSSSGISVVGLRARVNERGDYLVTTVPVSNEASTPSGSEVLFPHLANGGGYTTQFTLFSGTAGAAPSGHLNFYRQDGTPLDLTIN